MKRDVKNKKRKRTVYRKNEGVMKESNGYV